MQQGLLIVVSGPSGVGKGTLCYALREKFSAMSYSVSATTRPPRMGERNGIDYIFLNKEDFESMITKGEFLEWASVYGNYYGTPRAFVDETLASGEDILLEIDIQGALQVKKNYPEGITIFLVPPSLAEQRIRIQERGTEDSKSISVRLEAAQQELKYLQYYDYVVTNDKINVAVNKLEAILTAEKCRVKRNQDLLNKLVKGMGRV